MSEVPSVSLIVRVDLGAHGRLGPGKMLLLDNIDRLGSISAAGRAMNMSYRQSWELLDQLNRAFDMPLTTSQAGGRSGGGAVLTDFGRQILASYRAIVAATDKAAAAELAIIQTHLKPVDSAGA